MESSVLILLIVCLGVSTTLAQFNNPFLFAALGDDFGEGFFGGEGGGGYFLYDSLNRRLSTLELAVRTGAIGGCESGVLGPLSAAQTTGTIQFQGRFISAPSISLSVSDITTANAALPISFQIRPTSLTSTGATVTLTDATNNVAALFVSYMACPSNSNSNNVQAQPMLG